MSFPVEQVSSDATTVTLRWVPQPGDGYRFYRDGVAVSRSFDPEKSTVRIAKAKTYTVEVLHVSGGDRGEFPPPPEPEPEPTPDDPAAWGYRPPVPEGWQLIENQTVSVPSIATKRYYRNCKISSCYVRAGSEDVTFVDCDFRGTVVGTDGKRIRFYGCALGGVHSDTQERDGAQIKPASSGAARPEDWLFQGCSITNITRSGSYHTDGIQWGGSLRGTVRYCYFDNVSVEMILYNSWNGVPEDGLVEKSYFGSRTDPGGPPIHFSGTSKNCRAVDNYYDGTVASIASTTSGCSISGTQPRSAWTYGDPWETY